MSRIELPKDRSVRGIFQIDQRALEELDDIVSTRMKCLRRLRNQDITKDKENARRQAEHENANVTDESVRRKWIDAAIQRSADRYPLNRDELNWTIELRTGEAIHGKSLREVIAHKSIEQNEISKVSFKIQCGRYECHFAIRPYFWVESTADFGAIPSHLSESQRIISELDEWSKARVFGKPLCWWPFWAFMFRGLSVVLVMFWLSVFVAVWQTEYPKRSEFIRGDIKKLVDDGITSENSPRAIALLLELQLPDKVINDPKFARSKSVGGQVSASIVLVAILAIDAVVCCPPRTIIGVGKGKSRLKRSRRWFRFLFVLLPAFLLMGLLPSILGTAIYERITDWLK